MIGGNLNKQKGNEHFDFEITETAMSYPLNNSAAKFLHIFTKCKSRKDRKGISEIENEV